MERRGQLAHGDESKQSGEISLVYFLEKETGTENIIAHHEEQWVTLQLAEKPSANGGNPSKRDLGVGPPQFMVITQDAFESAMNYLGDCGQNTYPIDSGFPELHYSAGQVS